jgi:hypothetical protein
MELQAPDAFTCAITRDIMEDPVVAADGHSYERVAITHWLSRSRRSPMTNEPMDTELVPNIALRKAIGEWRTQAPLALDPADLTVSDSVLGVGSFGTVLAGTLKTGGREQERQARRESASKHVVIARPNMLSEANVASTVPQAAASRMIAESNAREAAAVAHAAALLKERDALKAQLAEAKLADAKTRLEQAGSCTKIFEISLMHGSASVRAEIEMIPSIMVSECAAVKSVAAAFRAFVPGAPLTYALRTFYTGHQGAPHELFAIIVSADWGAQTVGIPSHMLHMIGPKEWIYDNTPLPFKPQFKPTRNIGMNIGDIFVHSEPRKPGYQYPCGPHAYTITPNTKSFGICVGGQGYRGDLFMDGLVVGRLKDAAGVMKALLGPGSLPRYFQTSLPR